MRQRLNVGCRDPNSAYVFTYLVVTSVVLPELFHVVEDLKLLVELKDLSDVGDLAAGVAELIERAVTMVGPKT